MPQSARIQYPAEPSPYPRAWRKPSSIKDYSSSRRDWFSDTLVERAETPKLILKEPEPLPVNEATFQKLARTWRKETAAHSSLAKKVMHPAYQRIIGMGPVALPLILRDMKRRHGHWFWALDAITQGETPAQGCKDLEEATKAWIDWGETKGYL
jgi:hypothetical protein